jgi:flagellar motor protein MotB
MVIREELESIGIDQGQLRVKAYADTKPLNGDKLEELDRETYLAKHRRVVIRLY